MSKSKLISHSSLSDVVPAHIRAMREAVSGAVSADDIKEIVQKQVQRAKEGDSQAIKFVFDYCVGGMDLKGATFVQKNYIRNGEKNGKP